MLKRGSETVSETTAAIGRMFAAVRLGFTSRTTLRIDRVNAVGSPAVRTITYSHMNGVCANGV